MAKKKDLSRFLSNRFRSKELRYANTFPLVRKAELLAELHGESVTLSTKEEAWALISRYYLNHKPRRKLEKSHYPSKPSVATDEFLLTYAWRKLRIQALLLYEQSCACCGATRDDGVKLHVDHIKPRLKYPALALDIDNLQILCEVCNHGKGNWLEHDFRQASGPLKHLSDESDNHLSAIVRD